MTQIFFRYIRSKRGRHRGKLIGCIAVCRDTGEIGWSYCTPTSPDQFRKETARKIAIDRLGVYNTVLGSGEHQKRMPDRVRREIELTKNWLTRKV